MENEIKELQDKLDALKLKYEQSKQPFKDGGVVNLKGTNNLVKITDIEKGKGYGINSNNEWSIGIWSFGTLNNEWQLSTPEKWLEVCTKEAEKRGFKKGVTIDKTILNYTGKKIWTLKSNDIWVGWNGMQMGNDYIMYNGIWATVIPNDKTLVNLIMDYNTNKDYPYGEIGIEKHINDNKEAYIKALQNLKK